MKSLVKLATIITASAAAFVSMPTFAVSSGCTTSTGVLRYCKTGTIPANAQRHFIHIDVTRFVTYKLNDAKSGKIVASGKTGSSNTNKTTTGLYGRYYAQGANIPPILLRGKARTTNI